MIRMVLDTDWNQSEYDLKDSWLNFKLLYIRI